MHAAVSNVDAAWHLELRRDGGVVAQANSTAGTSSFASVAPGTYDVVVVSADAGSTVLQTTTIAPASYQAVVLYSASVPQAAVATPAVAIAPIPPLGTTGTTGVRRLRVVHALADLAGEALRIDTNGDGTADSAPITFGSSVDVDLPNSSLELRVVPATASSFIPFSVNYTVSGGRGLAVLYGLARTLAPTTRARTVYRTHLQDPAAAMQTATRNELPLPKLQVLNLKLNATFSLIVNTRTLQSQAGFAALTPPFTLDPNIGAYAFRIQNSQGGNVGDVGSLVLQAGDVGVVIYPSGSAGLMKLMNPVSARSTGDAFLAVHALDVSPESTRPLFAGEVGSNGTATYYQGSTTLSTSLSLTANTFPTTVSNLVLRVGAMGSTQFDTFKTTGFTWANKTSVAILSPFGAAGTLRRVVQLEAPADPYAAFTATVLVPCQGSLTCTP